MEDSVVRIRNQAGVVVGTGFLISSSLVCTCAHVVAQATGTDPRAAEPPAGPIELDFPLAGAGVLTATVDRWIPVRDDETGDLAVLRLGTAAPASVRPARLSAEAGGWNDRVRIFGFPTGRDSGVWVSGRLRDRQATGWVQVEAMDGPRVTAGFSGAPVWRESADEVVGMVIAAERDAGTAYLAPTLALLDDDLVREVLPESPYRGMEAFRESDAAVFFGRQRETRRLAEYVAHRSVVVVSGRSGCGKSSLVRAALLPELRAAGATIVDIPALPVPAADQPAPSGRELLCDALLPTLGPAWVDRMREQPPTQVGAGLATEYDRVVLFLDQFEEVATAAPETARDLVTLLAELVSGARPRPGRPPTIQVIMTLRSPAIDEVFTAEHAEVLDDGTVHVLPMGREDLQAAIAEPVREAGLVRFEPGLVDRIVDDAVAAPGQLPLVQFALTLLWERQRGGLLTHAAYTEIGQVAGAIAEYADTVYRHLPTATDRDRARKLLVRLARATDDGSFVLAPARLDDLGPELAELADRLAARRLVVIRQDREQPATVALAHQALIEQWRTLHDWLAEDRDFLTWHARLRRQVDEWKAANEDSGGLLRGGPLAEAESRAAERRDALTGDERRFIEVSRAAARRGIRRWRIVTAVITTLAVAAAGLAVAALDQSRELAERLRRQAAVALARESMTRMGTHPDTSLQFAQAAAAHDPDSRDAEAAVLLQQARYAEMGSYRTGLWSEQLLTAAASTDGSVIATVETDGTVTVWTGLLGGKPASWPVTSADDVHGVARSVLLSGDGSRMALFGERGSIEVWDVARRTGPVALRATAEADDPWPARALTSAFTADGRTLVVGSDANSGQDTFAHTDLLEVYDAVSGRQLPTAIDLAGVGNVDVLRLEAAGRVVWLREYLDASEDWRNVARDLTTGQLLRTLPSGWVAADGTILSCSDDVLTGHDGNTGGVRFRTALPKCPPDGPLEATRRYVLLANGLAQDLFQFVTMVDSRTGEAFQVRFPHNPRDASQFSNSSMAFVHPTPDGPELMVVGRQGLWRTLPGTRRDDPAEFTQGFFQRIQFNARGTLVAHFDRPRQEPHADLAVYELPSQRRIAGGPGTPLAGLDFVSWTTSLFTLDDRFLLAEADNDEMVVLSTDDYTVQRRIRLPIPPGVGQPRTLQGRSLSLIPLRGDEVVVLYAGILTRWRVGTGEQIGEALPLSDDPAGLRQTQEVEAEGRPGHPDQVFVPIYDGVELWDLNIGGKVGEFRPEPYRRMRSAAAGPHSPLVALHTESGLLHLWDPEQGTQAGEPSPLPVDRRLIDIGPNNHLVVQIDGEAEVELWDITAGQRIVAIDPPGVTSTWHVAGNTLLGLSDDGLLAIDLDRESALAKLCAFQDRPYTESELRLLPDGADTGPPCRIQRG